MIEAQSTEARADEVKKFTDQIGEHGSLAREQFRLFESRWPAHEMYVKRRQKCAEYYIGEQWAAADTKKLDAEGRPALTINTILPIINTILGEQLTKRVEPKIKPKKDATIGTANVLAKVVTQILDENQYDFKESEVFADGIIEERGFFDVRMDFDENLQGKVVIDYDDPAEVMLDPEAKRYEPSTWEEVMTVRWRSLDQIAADFGQENADRLEYVAHNATTMGMESIRYERRFGNETHPDRASGRDGWEFVGADNWTTDATKRKVKCVRVIERQFYQVTAVHFFVDPATGDSKQVPESWDIQKATEFARAMNLFLHKKNARKIRWRVTADSILLHDQWSPYKTFTKIPYFPYFRRGKPFGAVTNLISPQDQLNKTESQILHVVNSTANGGWIVESGSLKNMTVQQLGERGAQTGLVIEVAADSESPQKIQPNQIPTGLTNINMKSSQNIRTISGVNESMLGIESAEVSGIALTNNEKRGQVQIQVALNSLARTRLMVMNKVIELVQQFYTEERVFMIVNDRPVPGAPEQEELVINGVDPYGDVINDITMGQYDVVIGTQPARDSFNDSQFAEALALREMNVMIPDDRIIEYSNLEKKFELAEESRQMSGRGARSAEEEQIEQMMAEMGMMRMRLELAELEGKVMVLQSQANLNEAKAGEVDQKTELEIERISAKIQEVREGYETRLRLAFEQSSSKMDLKAMEHRGKMREKVADAIIQSKQPRNKN